MWVLWLAFLARDLLQVALSGVVPVPDFTVLALAWLAVSRSRDPEGLFLPAFAAGLLWDLRWTAIPGMTAVTYILAAATIAWLWARMSHGRGKPVLFFLLVYLAHLVVSSLPFLLFRQGEGGFSVSVAQQAMALVCVLALTALYIWSGRTSHE